MQKNMYMPKEKEKEAISHKVRVLSKEWLTNNTFILRIERKGLQFLPGQYLVLQEGDGRREYSICSGLEDDYIEVMVRLIREGIFTPRLTYLQKGDYIKVEGPYGFFTMRQEEMHQYHYYFIATGVGISPFLSFIRSYSQINYTLLHGVRNVFEAYRYRQMPDERRIICTSGDDRGDFCGRVTEYMKAHNIINTESIYYLCGNSDMIDEVTEYLESGGIDPFDIRQEVFF